MNSNNTSRAPPAKKSAHLPGAASLHEELGKRICVSLRDGRQFQGWLRSFDQYANLVLDGTIERLICDTSYCDVQIGIFIVRGENVMMLGEIDPAGEARFQASIPAAPEKAVREQLEKSREDKGTLANRQTFWPIPEEF